ncbi:MAG: hypothetical protein HY023_15490 [Chloroflexi bacterium]|nr:hypothetical protein [Chloroflexota bacterium]
MKLKRTRDMRDIPTIQGLRHRAMPRTREQALAEMVRLEHEKARLGRELNIWADNQKRTEDRLRHVEERLALVPKLLDEASAAEESGKSNPEWTSGDERQPKRRREIRVEY